MSGAFKKSFWLIKSFHDDPRTNSHYLMFDHVSSIHRQNIVNNIKSFILFESFILNNSMYGNKYPMYKKLDIFNWALTC